MSDLPLAIVRQDLTEFCSDVSASVLLPAHLRNRSADMMVILMTGHELGLKPMQAIASIHVIEGKPTMSSSLMLALVLKSGVCRYMKPTRSDADCAEYETLRQGWDAPVRMSYTIAEARAAGLGDKANWKKHPASMLRARCISAMVRACYPDLMLGVYETDEGEEFEPVRILEGVVVNVSDQAPAVAPPVSAKERLGKKKTATQEQLVDALVDFGASPSRFREWLAGQPEFAGKEVPPVSAWDAERLGWAVAALRNGLGVRFRADIAAADEKDGDDFADDGAVPE